MTVRHAPQHRRELEPFEKRGDHKLPLYEAKLLQLKRQLGRNVTIVGFDLLNAMGEDLYIPAMNAEQLAEFKASAAPIIARLALEYGRK
jgi:hypothetical protein